MLRRLFIAVLIACLAMPAMAAGHHHHAPAPKSTAIPAAHVCIGCIAALPAVAVPDAPVKLLAMVPHRPGQVQLTGLPCRPGTPPPRA